MNFKKKTQKILLLSYTNITNYQFYNLPSCHLTIDESMIKFDWRRNLMMYMPLKPIRRGSKYFILSEATTGYVYNRILYTGDCDDEIFSIDNIIRKLTMDLEGENFRIFMNRFYTSPKICFDLMKFNFSSVEQLWIIDWH